MIDEGDRSAVAELVAAVAALKVAENLFVDDIADFAAGDRSGGTTEQTAKDGASETAEQHAGRASDGTDGCASLSTG
jgi:hypothetical protein